MPLMIDKTFRTENIVLFEYISETGFWWSTGEQFSISSGDGLSENWQQDIAGTNIMIMITFMDT